MKLSKGESRQKSPVTEQYRKIMRQYKSAIKRADVAGYKTQAIIPVVVPDQSKRSSTAKLKAAYKKFKASVQRERNVKLAEQRIATRNYNKFKRAAAKAKEKEEKVKTPKNEPTPKTSAAQERQREETTTPKQQPNANPIQKQRTKPLPDYDYMAFNNLQNVVSKALFIHREAKSEAQQRYFDNVERRAADIVDVLDSLHFYSPQAAAIYGDRIDKVYKQIQYVMEAYAWYDSQGMIDTADDLDELKRILTNLITNLEGSDEENIRIQKQLNETFGDTGSGEPATY